MSACHLLLLIRLTLTYLCPWSSPIYSTSQTTYDQHTAHLLSRHGRSYGVQVRVEARSFSPRLDPVADDGSAFGFLNTQDDNIGWIGDAFVVNDAETLLSNG